VTGSATNSPNSLADSGETFKKRRKGSHKLNANHQNAVTIKTQCVPNF